MDIDKKDFEAKIDRRFIKKLQSIYIGKTLDRRQLLDEAYGLLTRNEYMPGVPEFVIDFDKGKGVARYVPAFTPLDYVIYFYCVLSVDEYLVAKRVEGTFGGYSMGGALRRAETVESNSPEPPSPNSKTFNPYAYIQHYGQYNAEIRKRLIDEGEYNIVELDIANFYDHIRLDLLENLVRSSADNSKEPQVNLLFHFLRNWNKLINSYRPQSVGLPQELVGDCSRILANFYLQEYDQAVKTYCDKHNIRFLRYADDQIFFVPVKFDARKLVRKASIELSKIGLNINPKKVNIWNDKESFRKYKVFDLFELLPQNVTYPKDHTEETANAFAEALLDADRKNLVKSGAPVIKTMISIGLNKLNSTNRKRILKLINNEYLVTLSDKHIDKLLKVLTKSERHSFLTRMDKKLAKHLHNAQKYEVYKVASGNKLRRFNKYKKDILENTDWSKK